VYPQGWHVALLAVWRDKSCRDQPFAWTDSHDDGVIRFGVSFADGRSVAMPLRGAPCASDDQNSKLEPLSIWGHGGRGASGRWEHRYWIEPLPPAGPVELYLQWRAAGIETTSRSLEGEQFAAAARAAKLLWSDSD
jgi:hypothetical protein